MKTTKRIMALVLAALMLAMMIPFAASAATEDVTFTLSYTKPADEAADTFEWTVYQLATLDMETGTYTTVAGLNSTIESKIKDNTTTSSAALLQACFEATSGYGVAVKDGANDKVFKSGDADLEYTVASGIYYVKCTKRPDNATKFNDSIVTLPYYQNNAWQRTLPANANGSTDGATNTIKLATKFSTSPVTLVKDVYDTYTNAWAQTTSQEIGEDVQFRTIVSTVGSADERINGFKVVDTMEDGLEFKSVDSVKFLATATATTGTDADGYTVTPTTGGHTFTVEWSKAYLTAATAPAFYAETSKFIEITYTCKVTKDATCGTDTNVNTAQLFYIPKTSTDWTDGPSDTAEVYTYQITVLKYDATVADKAKKLANAEFEIYTAATATGTPVAYAKTGTDGTAYFRTESGNAGDIYKFKKGTYYIKETKAPTGYNINSHIFSVEVGGDTSTAAATANIDVDDTPSKLPETGGTGNMMFTIIGGSLVLLAGALFVVIMKKRSSK